MLPAVHYNGEYCRRAKEPKEEVGAGLAWETKLIGLDRDCNSTVVACEASLVRFYGLRQNLIIHQSVPRERTARSIIDVWAQ